jgi:uncharacterized protein
VTTRHTPVLPIPDPRRPFVLDTRSLGRRPGTMWERRWTLPAPDGLTQAIVRVPEGAELDLQLRLETVLDGVLATATVTAPTAGECGRCLDEVAGTIEVHVTELYSYREQADRYARTSGDDQDDEVRHLDGDMLDLEQPVRDAVVLALPVSPLCRPDCGGLCPTCGAHLDEVGPQHTHDMHDPRWGALRGLTEIPLGED